jgi:hypothetical protein
MKPEQIKELRERLKDDLNYLEDSGHITTSAEKEHQFGTLTLSFNEAKHLLKLMEDMEKIKKYYSHHCNPPEGCMVCAMFNSILT